MQPWHQRRRDDKGRKVRQGLASERIVFGHVRARRGLIGVAVDPLTSHECGNQRYLAIRWLDRCLQLRLPKELGGSLREIDPSQGWLASTPGFVAKSPEDFEGPIHQSTWLPGEGFAKLWMQYVKDTNVEDLTPPPAPENPRIQNDRLLWSAKADLESGIGKFLIYRGENLVAEIKSSSPNRYGRRYFRTCFIATHQLFPSIVWIPNPEAESGELHEYRIVSVNTVGLRSEPSVTAERD